MYTIHNNVTMVHAAAHAQQQQHVLHSRERPSSVMPTTAATAGESISYYAHVGALVILYCLWRFPLTVTANNAKSFKQPGFVFHRDHHHPHNHHRLRSDDSTTSTREEESSSTSTSLSSDDNRQKEIDHHVLQHDDAMREHHPNATEQERRRFLIARMGNVEAARAQLGNYLEWRGKHDDIERSLNLVDVAEETDEDDWNTAVAVALVSCGEEEKDEQQQDQHRRRTLPRIARVYTADDNNGSAVCDRDGHRVLHVMPGQIDIGLAKASTYAVALALYIDRKLHRTSLERLTVALDVRGGRGWPNVPPLKQLPFIQTVIQLLLAMFPERLHQCLLFPVPKPARWIWNIARAWIDPLTSRKVQLLTGQAKIVSQPPLAAMAEFLDPHIAEFFERQRHASFVVQEEQETC